MQSLRVGACTQDSSWMPRLHGVRDAALGWILQSPEQLDLIRRLVGLIAIPIGVNVYAWAGTMPSPYLVPAWRIGGLFLSLPQPPAAVNVLVFCAYFLSCVWMITGSKRTVYPAIIAATIAYYSSLELLCAGINFVIMLLGYTVALCLADGEKPSASRRIIQTLVCSCYFYSAMQKLLFAQFLSGESLRCEFADGWSLNALWQFLVPSLQKLPDVFWVGGALSVILLELFLCCGLMRQVTRKVALFTGAIFHALIVVFMDPFLSMFSAVMLIGYLAFLQSGGSSKSAGLASSIDFTWRTAVAWISFLFILVFPARIYCEKDFSSPSMTFLDRTPWSFSMFLMRQRVQSVTAVARNEDGREEALELSRRMNSASSENELMALARHLGALHPGAKAILVASKIQVNDSLVVRKLSLNMQSGETSISTRAEH